MAVNSKNRSGWVRCLGTTLALGIAGTTFAQGITLRWAEVTGFPFAPVIEAYSAPLYKELTGVEVVPEVAMAPTTRDKMLLESIAGTGYFHMGSLSSRLARSVHGARHRPHAVHRAARLRRVPIPGAGVGIARRGRHATG